MIHLYNLDCPQIKALNNWNINYLKWRPVSPTQKLTADSSSYDQTKTMIRKPSSNLGQQVSCLLCEEIHHYYIIHQIQKTKIVFCLRSSGQLSTVLSALCSLFIIANSKSNIPLALHQEVEGGNITMNHKRKIPKTTQKHCI